jgi:hypothetical protein
MTLRGKGDQGSPEALSKSARKLAALAQDPVLDALRMQLRELALEARASVNEEPVMEADVRRAELEAQIAQAGIFLAIQDERQNRRLPGYERLRALRAWKVEGEPFDIDHAARLVRIVSLKLEIRSRRHSEEEAIEASKGVKFQDLPSIERRAAEIVLGRRRAAKSNRREPASRIANQVRSEWLALVPSVRCNNGTPISISSIVRIAIPILDQLAGKTVASGIPTSGDLRSMKSAGMAALFAIVQLEYGSVTPLKSVYEVLLEFRREQSGPDVTY